MIKLYGTSLQLDDLHIAYQEGVSSAMRTWTVIETINYFTRNGSDVFAASMDMTKAFDGVQPSKLFRKLIDASMPPIAVRLLMVIYSSQSANVRWKNMVSEFFTLKNGCKQGAVLSGILYCVYVNDLFRELRRNGSGCSIDGIYMGVFRYSDDNFLLTP